MKDYRKKYPGYLKKSIDHDYEHKLSQTDKEYLMKFDREYYNGDYPAKEDSIYFNEKFIDLHRNKKFIDLFEKENQNRLKKEKELYTFDEFIVNHYQKKGSKNKRMAERNNVVYTTDLDNEHDDENDTIKTRGSKAEKYEKLITTEKTEEQICLIYLKNKQLDLYIKNKLIEFIDDFNISNKSKIINKIEHDYEIATKANKFQSLYKILIALKLMSKTKEEKRELEILEKLFDTFVFKDNKKLGNMLEV